MTAPTFLGPRIDYADRVLRESGDEKTWPKGREAVAMLTWAKRTLTEAVSAYYTALEGFNDFSSEEEDAAVEQAEEAAYDAALALENRLNEYRKRESASLVAAARGEKR